MGIEIPMEKIEIANKNKKLTRSNAKKVIKNVPFPIHAIILLIKTYQSIIEESKNSLGLIKSLYGLDEEVDDDEIKNYLDEDFEKNNAKDELRDPDEKYNINDNLLNLDLETCLIESFKILFENQKKLFEYTFQFLSEEESSILKSILSIEIKKN
jgi:hypothetical protein